MYNSQRMTSIPLPNFSRRKIILLRRGRSSASKIRWANLEQCQIIPSILRKINLSILSRWKARESAVIKCSNPKKYRAWKDPIIYILLNNFNVTKHWWISIPSWVSKRVSLSTILTKSKPLKGMRDSRLNQEISLKRPKWKAILREEELFFSLYLYLFFLFWH